MTSRRHFLAIAAALVLVPGTALADWPERAVTIIVPFAPGGATDITARILADELGERFGQPFVVENREGAAGNIGVEAAARAAPDGYTFLFATQGTMTVNPHIYADAQVDIDRDLTPVSQTFAVDHVMVVNPALGVSTVAEFVELAKQKPGELTYGSAGVGSFLQLTTIMLEQATDIELSHVPYRGSAPAQIDLIAGNIDMVMDSVPTALGQIQGGALVALALTSGTRNPSLPDVPTMIEAGVEGYDIASWGGLMAPAGTPDEIVQTLSAAVNEAYGKDEVRAQFDERGVGAAASTPEDFAALIRRDSERFAAIVDSAGISIDQ